MCTFIQLTNSLTNTVENPNRGPPFKYKISPVFRSQLEYSLKRQKNYGERLKLIEKDIKAIAGEIYINGTFPKINDSQFEETFWQ